MQVQQSLMAWNKTVYLTLGHWIVAGSAVSIVGMQHDLGPLNCCRFSSRCWHATWPWVIEWIAAGSAVIVVNMKYDLGLLNELLQVWQSLLLAWNMTFGYWMNCCRFSSHCCWHETWPWVIEWTITGSAVIIVGMKHNLMLAWNTTWGYWMNCCRWPKNWWIASPAWLQWATCHKSRMSTTFYCKLPVARPATLPPTGSVRKQHMWTWCASVEHCWTSICARLGIASQGFHRILAGMEPVVGTGLKGVCVACAMLRKNKLGLESKNFFFLLLKFICYRDSKGRTSEYHK